MASLKHSKLELKQHGSAIIRTVCKLGGCVTKTGGHEVRATIFDVITVLLLFFVSSSIPFAGLDTLTPTQNTASIVSEPIVDVANTLDVSGSDPAHTATRVCPEFASITITFNDDIECPAYHPFKFVNHHAFGLGRIRYVD